MSNQLLTEVHLAGAELCGSRTAIAIDAKSKDVGGVSNLVLGASAMPGRYDDVRTDHESGTPTARVLIGEPLAGAWRAIAATEGVYVELERAVGLLG